MTQPTLALLDHELPLREAVRSFVDGQAPVADVRTLREDEALGGYRAELWKSIAALDWVGLTTPIEAGGAGGTLTDLGIVVEGLGRNLVSTPLRAVSEALTILTGADGATTSELVEGILAGASICVLAHDEGARSVRPLRTTAHVDGSLRVLTGTKELVPFGAQADVLVVSAALDDAGTPGLFAVERDRPGISTQSVRLMDTRPRARVVLDGVTVPASALIAEGVLAAELLAAAWEHGAVLTAAESLGSTRAALDLTCAHLRNREQFGVAIGTFQALQHRAARMFVAAELAESATRAALRECDVAGATGTTNARVAISVAKAMTNDAFSLVAREGVQLHGGMGMTDEANIGLYLKRMMVACTEYGDTRLHVRRVAQDALGT